MNDLRAARQSFVSDWRDLKQSLQKETGLTTTWSRSWIWPALALTVGVAAGAGYLWRRDRSERG